MLSLHVYAVVVAFTIVLAFFDTEAVVEAAVAAASAAAAAAASAASAAASAAATDSKMATWIPRRRAGVLR